MFSALTPIADMASVSSFMDDTVCVVDMIRVEAGKIGEQADSFKSLVQTFSSSASSYADGPINPTECDTLRCVAFDADAYRRLRLVTA